MADRPRIFISAVTSEFKTVRQMVANQLTKLDYDPVVEDIFSTEAGDIRDVLRRKIDDCWGLVQIIGDAYGLEPPEHDDQFGRVSYTQFEFFYARSQNKKTWLIVAQEGCTRDTQLEQLDLPREENHPDPFGYQSERRNLQRQYRQDRSTAEALCHPAKNDTELALIITGLRDDREEAILADQRRRKLVTIALASIVLGSIATAIGVWQRPFVADELSLSGFHVKSDTPAARGLAVDTDPLLVTWLAKGAAEEVRIFLENPRTGERTSPKSVLSSEGKVRFEPGVYHALLDARRPGEVNSLRVVAQGNVEAFTSAEFEVAVGITILVIVFPDKVTVAAQIDQRLAQAYDFEIEILIPRRDPAKTAEVIRGTIAGGKRDFAVNEHASLDWLSMKPIYLGPDEPAKIRFETLVDDSLKVDTSPGPSAILGGKVEDNANGEPIADAKLMIEDFKDSSGKTPVAKTDDSGYYEFHELSSAPTGQQVRVRIEKSGFRTKTEHVTLGSRTRNFYLDPE